MSREKRVSNLGTNLQHFLEKVGTKNIYKNTEKRYDQNVVRVLPYHTHR